MDGAVGRARNPFAERFDAARLGLLGEWRRQPEMDCQ